MNKRWELKVLNAKAAHRAWSKQRVIYAIITTVLASLLSFSPSAYAQNASEAQASAVSVERAQDVSVGNVNAGADKQTNAVHVPADDAKKEGAQKEHASVVAPAANASVDLLSKNEKLADVASVPNVQAQPSEDPQSVPNASSQHAPKPFDPKKYVDSLGTRIEFDWNKDGKTTDEDWLAFRKWLSAYKPLKNTPDGPDNAEGGNTALGAIQIYVGKKDKGDVSLDKTIDVTKARQYYLQNVGQLTPPRNQGSLGTCWSHAIMAELESAYLKKKQGDGGRALEEARHKSPILSNIPSDIDLSEVYMVLKAYTLQHEGSQKGEGVKQIDAKTGEVAPVSESLNLGGFTDFNENILTNWDGVVTEKDEPYWPKKDKVAPNLDNQLKALLGIMSRSDKHKRWDTANYKLDDVDKGLHNKPLLHVDGVYYLPSFNNYKLDGTGEMSWVSRNPQAVKRVKEALVKYGVVQISMNASDVQNYQYDDGATTVQNHAVSIVGWNDDISADKFTGLQNGEKPAGNGAWLVKNSWGSSSQTQYVLKNLQKEYKLSDEALYKKVMELLEGTYKTLPKERLERYAKAFLAGKSGWGLPDAKGNNSGFFWVSYYDRSITGPQAASVDIADDGFDYDNNYSYNNTKTGTSSPFALSVAGEDTTVANVFAAKGEEVLKAVSVRSQIANTKAQISVYVQDAQAQDETNPLLGARLVADEEFVAPTAGFHTVKLSRDVRLHKGQKFVVVQTLVSEDEKGARSSWLNLETGLAQGAQNPNPDKKFTDDGLLNKGLPMQYMWTHVVANAGETYVRLATKDDLKWVSPKELSHALSSGDAFEFGNALIKAFTKNYVAPLSSPENVLQGLPVSEVVSSASVVVPDGASSSSATYANNDAVEVGSASGSDVNGSSVAQAVYHPRAVRGYRHAPSVTSVLEIVPQVEKATPSASQGEQAQKSSSVASPEDASKKAEAPAPKSSAAQNSPAKATQASTVSPQIPLEGFAAAAAAVLGALGLFLLGKKKKNSK